VEGGARSERHVGHCRHERRLERAGRGRARARWQTLSASKGVRQVKGMTLGRRWDSGEIFFRESQRCWSEGDDSR
jgi:hypothetical protein